SIMGRMGCSDLDASRLCPFKCLCVLIHQTTHIVKTVNWRFTTNIDVDVVCDRTRPALNISDSFSGRSMELLFIDVANFSCNHSAVRQEVRKLSRTAVTVQKDCGCRIESKCMVPNLGIPLEIIVAVETRHRNRRPLLC